MLVNDVIRACEDRNRQLQVNPDLLQDFSQLKNRICARLVSRERNGELLKRRPTEVFWIWRSFIMCCFRKHRWGC